MIKMYEVDSPGVHPRYLGIVSADDYFEALAAAYRRYGHDNVGDVIEIDRSSPGKHAISY